MTDERKLNLEEKETTSKRSPSNNLNILYGLKTKNNKNHKVKKPDVKKSPIKKTIDLDTSLINASSLNKINKLLNNCKVERKENKSPKNNSLFKKLVKEMDLDKVSNSSKISKLKFDILNISNNFESGRSTPSLIIKEKNEPKCSKKISLNLYEYLNTDTPCSNNNIPKKKNDVLNLLKKSPAKYKSKLKGKVTGSQNKATNNLNQNVRIMTTNKNPLKSSFLSTSNFSNTDKLDRFKKFQMKIENFIHK